MKVCIICEGSYPYVAGGVSSWVQMLIKSMPETEFTILSIATDREEMSEYRYEIPQNIKKITTVYLGEQVLEKKYSNIRLDEKDRRALRSLVVERPEDMDWKSILDFIKKYQNRLTGILMCEEFFKLTLELYQMDGKNTIFNEYLWSLRGMYLPLMSVLSQELEDADVYHAVSTGYAGILGSAASYINNRPFILSEHGIYTREREEDIIRSDWMSGDFKEFWIQFFKKLSLITYRQATLVTALFASARKLQVELGCPEEKIYIIPNGVDAENFAGLPGKTEEEKKYFDVGSVLRIVPIKDVKTMIMSFFLAARSIPEARLHLLGSFDENPEYYQECQELIKELNMENVRFYGQTDIRKYIGKFDLLLLTSISEGQPLAVLEGMAAGIPFICTNVGDCPGLMNGNEKDEFGKAGFIVPAMDADAVAQKIIYLAEHSEIREKMGKCGQKRVAEYYKKTEFLKKYQELYKKVRG